MPLPSSAPMADKSPTPSLYLRRLAYDEVGDDEVGDDVPLISVPQTG